MSDFLKRRRSGNLYPSSTPNSPRVPPLSTKSLSATTSHLAASALAAASSRSLLPSIASEDDSIEHGSLSLDSSSEVLEALYAQDFDARHVATLALELPFSSPLLDVEPILSSLLQAMEQRWRVSAVAHISVAVDWLGWLHLALLRIVDGAVRFGHGLGPLLASDLAWWDDLGPLPDLDRVQLLVQGFLALLRASILPENLHMGSDALGSILAAASARCLATKPSCATPLLKILLSLLRGMADRLDAPDENSGLIRDVLAGLVEPCMTAMAHALLALESSTHDGSSLSTSVNSNHMVRTFQVVFQVWGGLLRAFIVHAHTSPHANRGANSIYSYILTLLELETLTWPHELLLESAAQWVLDVSLDLVVSHGPSLSPEFLETVLVVVAQMMAFMSEKAAVEADVTVTPYPGLFALDAHLPHILSVFAWRVQAHSERDRRTAATPHDNVSQLMGEALLDALLSLPPSRLHAILSCSSPLLTTDSLQSLVRYGLVQGLLVLAVDEAEAGACAMLLEQITDVAVAGPPPVKLGKDLVEDLWVCLGACLEKWISSFSILPHEPLARVASSLAPHTRQGGSPPESALLASLVLAGWTPAGGNEDSFLVAHSLAAASSTSQGGVDVLVLAAGNILSRALMSGTRLAGVFVRISQNQEDLVRMARLLYGAFAEDDPHALVELAMLYGTASPRSLSSSLPPTVYLDNPFLDALGAHYAGTRTTWAEARVRWTAISHPLQKESNVPSMLQDAPHTLKALVDALCLAEAGEDWETALDILSVLDAAYSTGMPRDVMRLASRRARVYDAMLALGRRELLVYGVILVHQNGMVLAGLSRGSSDKDLDLGKGVESLEPLSPLMGLSHALSSYTPSRRLSEMVGMGRGTSSVQGYALYRLDPETYTTDAPVVLSSGERVDLVFTPVGYSGRFWSRALTFTWADLGVSPQDSKGAQQGSSQ